MYAMVPGAVGSCPDCMTCAEEWRAVMEGSPDKGDKRLRAWVTLVQLAPSRTLILNCHHHVPFVSTLNFGSISEMMGSKIRLDSLKI
jgi:hypothetical protein